MQFQLSFLIKVQSIHETIIRTGTICKKIPRFMSNSASRGVLLKIQNCYEVMLRQRIFYQTFDRIS